ncbi:MAG: PhzF family phenazine biosynthesis protein [Candidatus Eremiobacteraeota bacterium]|nr:PhzF family phenazine biosynthesis protein [Candidatus Eremiobacteraeota bacterium]
MTQSSTAARTVDVEIVAAFTKDSAGGNLAGVVLGADTLSHDERQRIAASVALSETAFVRDAGDGVFEVAFYTPNKQVPDCGHATVATFALLAQRGALHAGRATKRTIIGDREITVEDAAVFMEQPRPKIAPFAQTAELAAALGIAADTIVREPVLADHGVRFVLVETTHDALASAVPDQHAIETLTEPPDAIGIYVFARGERGYDATVRMFAPRYGIPEEPATGMAAGLLGGYLAHGQESADYRFLQGALSPKPAPSELIVRVRPQATYVGGTATVLRTMSVQM